MKSNLSRRIFGILLIALGFTGALYAAILYLDYNKSVLDINVSLAVYMFSGQLLSIGAYMAVTGLGLGIGTRNETHPTGKQVAVSLLLTFVGICIGLAMYILLKGALIHLE